MGVLPRICALHKLAAPFAPQASRGRRLHSAAVNTFTINFVIDYPSIVQGTTKASLREGT